MRWLRRFFALVGLLIVLVVAAAGTAGYLAATGKSLKVVKVVAAAVADLLEGQHTEHLRLDVSLRPAEKSLSGRAELTVRGSEQGRQRFYFLLNDALRVQSVKAEGEPRVTAYQIWMMVVVDVGRPVKADETIALTIDYEGKPGGGPFGMTSGLFDSQNVMLGVEEFWFPADLQGQFTADVTVTLPARMTLVHAGDEQERSLHGRLQRVRWTYARPVPSLSLVAGSYRTTERHRDSTRYHVFLAEDVHLDAERILEMMADTNQRLSNHYGSAGYPTITLFVSRRLRRGYNDGTGLIGLSIRYFRRGDYGSEIIAHEVAHNWWGGTVMEQWLRPGMGGEWLVEGFAEFSSLVVTEEKFGKEALVRRLAREAFDPRQPRAVSEMSVLDNALAESVSREIIYNKGAYVAFMLRRVLGDELFFKGLRAFIEQFRLRAATDRDLQTVLTTETGKDVSLFFDSWVRSGRDLDLDLAAGDTEGKVALQNAGDNTVVEDADLWLFPSGAMEPVQKTLRVGEQLDLGAGIDHAVVDPQLAWADMRRLNNRFPQRRFPESVGISPAGVEAVVESGQYSWSPATLRLIKPGGAEFAAIDLEQTVLQAPGWIDEHRLLLSCPDVDSPVPAIVVLDTDNQQRQTIGRGFNPVATADTIYAARGDKLLSWSGPSWREATVWSTGDGQIETPVPSPDGTQLVYAVTRGNDLELRLRAVGGHNDRVLFDWDRSLRAVAWSGDGTTLFVAVGGDWDWQVWEVPVDGGPIQTLMEGAVAIGDLAVSPQGKRLAFAATPSPDYPRNRKEVFVLDPASKDVRQFGVSGADAQQVLWADADTLLVVAAPSGASVPWHLPEERRIERISVPSSTEY